MLFISNDTEGGFLTFRRTGGDLLGYVQNRGAIWLAVVGQDEPVTAWEKVFDTQHDAAKAVVMELINRSDDEDFPLPGGLVILQCRKNSSKQIGPYLLIEDVNEEAKERFVTELIRNKGEKIYELEEYEGWLTRNGYIRPLPTNYWLEF